MLIDTHCHLSDEKFEDDLSKVVDDAFQNGVEKIIVPATGMVDSELVDAVVGKFDNVFGLVGVHPESIEEIKNIDIAIGRLKTLLKNPKIVGIGEIGLDFYYDKEKETKGAQMEIFRAQLDLALELDLPVVIHSRSAGDEIREVFEGMSSLPRGQFHCFGEDEEFLRYVLDKGFYVSFCGNITYKNRPRLTPEESSRPPSGESLSLTDLAKMVPIERLLMETDSPYLSPEPLRGVRNEPKNVKITADFMADMLRVTREALAQTTTKNAESLFKI